MTTVIAFLSSIIGPYQYGETTADWAWIMSCAFLMLITWGIIIIVRSVVSRV